MWTKTRVFVVAILLITLSSATSLQLTEIFKTEHLGRVHQIEGVPVYLLSDPVKEYEIVQVIEVKRNSYSLRQALLKIILKVQKMQEKEKITGEYDAMIVSDTLDEVMLIRYIQ